MRRILVNTRNLLGHTTGVQRYTQEILARMDADLSTAYSSKWAKGWRGHAWEQLALPLASRGALLFSPSNTGPVSVKHQVITIHDCATLDYPELLNPTFARWYRFILPQVARKVRGIITVSDFSKNRIIAHTGVPEEKITVIPNGVDVQRFKGNRVKRLSARELGIPTDKYILSVGSVEPRKNLGRLLSAWARIQNTISDNIWLVIAGPSGAARVFAKEEGLDDLPPRVFLTGFVSEEELTDLYLGATLFAYPSLYEGFGLPPLEAMAAKVPVLTGNLTALPEVVGNAGLTVNPRDVDDIAKGLLRLVENQDLRVELAIRGHERVQKYTWDEAARRTLKLLHEAAGQ